MTNIDLKFNQLEKYLMTTTYEFKLGNRVVIVDSTVKNYQVLINGIILPTDVVVLDPNQNGLLQITDLLLRSYKEISELHFISHGSPGCLKLGSIQLNFNNISNYRNQLAALGLKLSNASIMLYGCQVAAGNIGRAFIRELQQLTGATIKASATTTGSKSLGGNWNLEVSVGQTIPISVIFSDRTMETYGHILSFESDDFNKTALDPLWTFINPLNDGSYNLTGTGTTNAYLELGVPTGVAHDVWNQNNSVRAMQSASNEDLEIEVKFESQPNAAYQMQGILVEQDANNWLRFDTFHDGSQAYVFAAITTNGNSKAEIQVAVEVAKYLRVNRQGDWWSLSYSPDGNSWIDAGSFQHSLEVNAVGPFAANAGSSPAFTAQVDYFFNTADPIILEDVNDEIAPTAALLAPDLPPIQGSNDPYAFTVSYTDTGVIKRSTLDDNDIRVTGPAGFDQSASLVQVYNNSDGLPTGAIYSIIAPGGTWDSAEEGEYAVIIQDNQVSDERDNFLAGGTLGSFNLNLNPVNAGVENIVFPYDAGVIDVTDYGAIPSDGIDDTVAIQQALDENASQNQIIYLPNGIYNVSATLEYANTQKRNILQGQSRDGTIIKLQNDLDFNQPVIKTGDPPAQRFRNSIRDVTVDVGSGNPDAIGINFMANNQGTLDNVQIVSRDGQGAIGLNLAPDENGPLLVKDVEVVGFDVGIRTFNPTASQTLERIKLVNQNLYGWQNYNQAIFVRDLESINAVPVIWNQPDGASDFTLLDGTLTGIGAAAQEPAIHNQKTMYVQNLNTSGYNLAILQDDQGRGNPSQPDGYVEEWMARDGFATLFNAPESAFELPVFETPEVPWDNLSDWVSPQSTSNDGLDDTSAIQAAVDSGASTVYLPNGVWDLNGTVELRNNVQRLVGTEARVVGGGTIKVAEGNPDTVFIDRLDAGSISFVQNSTRTMVMSNLIIDNYFNTTQGTGDLYIQDVSGGPWTFTNQNVWARQINPETFENPRIKNDDSNLWIFGYKTEDEGTLIETVNGGKTELFGAYILNGTFGEIPAFINNESSLSYVSASFRSFNGDPIPIGVEETHNLETVQTEGFPAYYTSTYF